jgi:putative transposase
MESRSSIGPLSDRTMGDTSPIGTLMGEVHLLPGTTFSSVAERDDYDSGKTAVMTIHELEAWLAWQIPGVYHPRNHAALGCSASLE